MKIFKNIIKGIIKYFLINVIPSKNNDVLSVEEAENIMQNHSPDACTSPLCKNRVNEKRFDLTVIVPVYNVEKYLNICLNSLRNQKTGYTYHIIAVNDGSTDRSGDILNAYSDWTDLMIINQENRGFSGARNTGLQYVFGKYIMFVDSDDYLPENAIESLLRAAYSKRADIVQGGFSYISENGQRQLAETKYTESSNVASNGVLAGMAWGKVYKSELWEKICFPERYWYEDTIITSILTHLASNIVTISDHVYFYRMNAAGITKSSVGKPKSIDTFYVLRCVMTARKELGMCTNQAFYEHLIRLMILCYKRTKKEPEIVRKSMFSLCKKMLEEESENNNFTLHGDSKYLEKMVLQGDFRRVSLFCALP